MQKLRTEPKPPLAWRIARWWIAAVIVAFVIVRVLGSRTVQGFFPK